LFMAMERKKRNHNVGGKGGAGTDKRKTSSSDFSKTTVGGLLEVKKIIGGALAEI